MAIRETKHEMRTRRKRRIRTKVSGSSDRPRLTVYKSNRQMYIQLIDDEKKVTLASVSTMDKKVKKEIKSPNLAGAKKLGQMIAEIALGKSIKTIKFDRNGYPYHGKVKAIADGAREKGLSF